MHKCFHFICCLFTWVADIICDAVQTVWREVRQCHRRVSDALFMRNGRSVTSRTRKTVIVIVFGSITRSVSRQGAWAPSTWLYKLHSVYMVYVLYTSGSVWWDPCVHDDCWIPQFLMICTHLQNTYKIIYLPTGQ